MSVPVERWTAGGTDFLVVDAADHVPDRRAFAAAHCGDGRPSGHDAAGVLFLARDDGPTPPRAVTTLVGPDGRSAVGPDAARVAAAWTARRTGAGAVMVDTPRGTRRAAVAGQTPESGFAVTVDWPGASGRPEAGGRSGTTDGAESTDGPEPGGGVTPVERAETGTLARVGPRTVE